MKRQPRAEPASGVSIPITPMLDMAFQLLTFFIFTYNPSGLEGQVELALPPVAANPDKPLGPPADGAVVPEIPDELNVLLQAREVGYTITLEKGLGRTDFGSDVKALKRHLTQVLRNKAGPRRGSIRLQADSLLKWHAVVEVMDACRQAGFASINFGSPPDRGQGRW